MLTMAFLKRFYNSSCLFVYLFVNAYNQNKINLNEKILLKSMDIARIELLNRTNFVNELYYSDANNKDDEITSNSYREFNKSTFYVPIDEKLEATHTDKTSNYKIKVFYDELLYLNCRLELPTLKVKEEYKDTVKIAWTHNLGHNIVKSGRLILDGKEYQKFDKVDLDIYYQYEVSNERKNQYKERIGSIPILENWTNHLPRYRLNIPQPFYFCKDISQNIPLKVFGVKEASFIYEFVLDIWKLLRISIYSSKTNTWQELRNPTKTKIEQLINGLNTSATLPLPELTARYVILTDEERNWRNSCLSKQVYYIDQMIDSSPANHVPIHQTAETKLVCNAPCRKIYWLAENTSGRDYNIYSNYTTSIKDMSLGWNPCASATLKYGQMTRFHFEQDVFTQQSADKHSIGTPNEPGYNMYSFSYDNNTFDADIGMSFNPPNNIPTFSIQITDTDPYKEEIKKYSPKQLNKDDLEEMLEQQESLEKESSKEMYQVHVRLLTYRRVKFEKSEKGDIVLSIDDN